MNPPSKKQIRSDWKKNYPEDPETRKRANRTTVAQILSTREFTDAKRIALYAPMPWELDITSLWIARPKACAFPKVVNNKLSFFCIPSLLHLKPGFAGILEPEGDNLISQEQWEATDLFLIPGVGFDLTGTRIGSGKGFYDRYFSENPQPLKWGVAFQAQISKNPLPREPHDVQMNALCTEKGITHVPN